MSYVADRPATAGTYVALQAAFLQCYSIQIEPHKHRSSPASCGIIVMGFYC